MKAREGAILEHAVDIGIKRGIRRFWKNRDDSLTDAEAAQLAEALADCVRDEVDSWFIFEENNLER